MAMRLVLSVLWVCALAAYVGKAQFVLKPLPYDTAALVPYTSNETVNLHYYKHHAGYVSTLNQLAAADPSLNKPLEDLVTNLPAGKPFNMAGQILNHDLYWLSMTPNGVHAPVSGPLYDAIVRDFGSVAQLLTSFTTLATAHFGSGWVFLVWTPDNGGRLSLLDTKDGDNPLSTHLPDAQRGYPLLAFDVWEHAYYVDYRNVRASFITAFTTHLVNWDFAATRLSNASADKLPGYHSSPSGQPSNSGQVSAAASVNRSWWTSAMGALASAAALLMGRVADRM